jgi:hypothetical protein
MQLKALLERLLIVVLLGRVFNDYCVVSFANFVPVTTQEFRCVNFAKIKNFLTELECYQFSSQIASPLMNSPPD